MFRAYKFKRAYVGVAPTSISHDSVREPLVVANCRGSEDRQRSLVWAHV